MYNRVAGSVFEGLYCENFFGSTKMEISTGKNLKSRQKKSGKVTLPTPPPPPEKYFC